MTDDEHQTLTEIRSKVENHEKIFAPEVQWLLAIIDRQAQELKQQKAANIESAAARVKLRPLYKALAHWRYGLFDKVAGKDISAIGGSSSAVYQLAESWDLIERPFGHFIKGEGDKDD